MVDTVLITLRCTDSASLTINIIMCGTVIHSSWAHLAEGASVMSDCQTVYRPILSHHASV